MRLLVIDDSALMRRYLRELFADLPGWDVQTARTGIDGLALLETFRPDVITLDINMPEMDGLTCLSRIMTQQPTPVVMVSSLTEPGALATLEALQMGAVDFVAKPGGTVSLNFKDIGQVVIEKVKAASRARPRAVRPAAAAAPARRTGSAAPRPAVALPPSTPSPASSHVAWVQLVLIGVSTGGPRTLEDVLPPLPANFSAPVLIAQHMPATFTRALAERLTKLCHMPVDEVDRPMPLRGGRIYLAQGDHDVAVTRRLGQLIAEPVAPGAEYPWHPSVERMARSAMEHINARHLVGVLLTGMGNDGANAFTDIKRGGGHTIAEAETSCVVFGMPKDLIERGGADLVLPSSRIGGQVVQWTEAAPTAGVARGSR